MNNILTKEDIRLLLKDKLLSLAHKSNGYLVFRLELDDGTTISVFVRDFLTKGSLIAQYEETKFLVLSPQMTLLYND